MARPQSSASTETRWPAAIAIVGLLGSALALPDSMLPGPPWLGPVLIGALLVPTWLAHRAGRHELDMILGYALSILVTLVLIFSLGSLLRVLPTKSETPAELLKSASILWVTNILVFSLWYWRLDAGGPHEREKRGEHSAGAFFFPQMMDGAPKVSDTWVPHFIDYLFIAFTTSTAFSPTDTPVLSRWAKVLTMVQAMISLLCIAVLASRAVGLL